MSDPRIALGQACIDWVADTGTCHFCPYSEGSEPHSGDCPILGVDAPRPVDPKSDREAVLEAANLIRGYATETSYGYPHSANPNDFFPDPEGLTPEEAEAHRLACERWNAGDHEPPPPSHTFHDSLEAAHNYIAEQIKAHRALAGTVHTVTTEGKYPVHCNVVGWGLGTTTTEDADLIALADRLERIANGDAPGDGG